MTDVDNLNAFFPRQTSSIPSSPPPTTTVPSYNPETTYGAPASGSQLPVPGDPAPANETVRNGTPDPSSSTAASSGSAAVPSVSSGAVAGAAVGCLVAGLLVGALAAFLLLRRRNKRHFRRSPLNSELAQISVVPEPKGLEFRESDRHGSDIQMSHFLLDATPDKEISSEAQALGELIQQHIENHYHLHPVQASPQALAPGLLSLGLGELSKLRPEEIASFCIDPKTRHLGLQHVISLVIFGSNDFTSRSRFSMLPTSMALFIQSVPPVESRGGHRDATSLALSNWRALSAYLLHPSRSQRTLLTPAEPETSTKAQSLAIALNTYLHHFIPTDKGSQSQQLEHLQAVIMECTKFGYGILSQPSDWRFVYWADDVGAASARSVVVCPGLDKLGSKDGKIYSSPRRVVAPVVAQATHRSR